MPKTRILVVEDSPTQAEELRVILESEGYEVSVASEAQGGITLLRDAVHDLVVSDIVMPGFSGYELCRRIKTDRETRDIPVVLLTSLSDPMDIIQGLECGADNFITKPYDSGLLLQRIASILENRRVRLEGKLKLGVEIIFLGKRFTITSDKEQILDLLISTFEDIVRTNTELQASRAQLAAANIKIRDYARQLEGKVRTTEEQYQDVVENATDGIIVLGKDGWIRDINGAAERMFERSRFEVLGKPFTALLPEQYWTPYASGHGPFSAEGMPDLVGKLLELKGQKKNGAFFPVELTISSHHVQDEVFFTSIIRDVSERNRIEAENARLAAAVHQADVAILITDANGVIEYVNPSFEQITGYARQDVVGQTPRVLKSGRQEPKYYEDLWKTITAGAIWSGRLTNKRKDGTVYESEASILPVRDQLNNVVGYVGAHRDVSKQLELESQVRQLQKLDAIGALAGGIAHDFNNVLTVIKGYSDILLLEQERGDSASQALDRISKAADTAASLTRQLLAFARKQIMAPEILDINRLITEMEKMCSRLIGEDIEFTTSLDPNLGKVKADPGQIEQVLLNLVVNARDAMPRGGKLTVTTANVELDETYAGKHISVQPGSFVMMSVSDNGHGMSAETQARIFEPFFTTKESGKGTGLGLSTAYGIVKQSGGNIWVYSELNQGTTFKVYFPRVAEEQPVAIPPLARTEILRHGSETVLVIEDNKMVRDLVVWVLTSHGYDVLTACDGEEALQICRRYAKPISLVLTDIVMPGVSGPDLAVRLRELFPNARVLFMSGHTDKAIVQNGILTPGTPFLQKPFMPEDLLRKIRQILDAPDKDFGMV